MIPSNITKEHIIEAINEIEKNNNQIPASRKSVIHLLEYNGKTYPPKYVISLANKYANGKELDPFEFSGGPESNSFLNKLGFKIIPLKDSNDLIEYWKIIPGVNGENWEYCNKDGYIYIMWGGIGDITGLSEEEFDKRCVDAMVKYSDYKQVSLNQVWDFAHIPIGSIIVANEGNSAILGFGRVIGKYYYVDDYDTPHRLPVEWFDTDKRYVDENWGGKWMNQLSKEKVDRLLAAMIYRNVWWVNQGDSYERGKEGGYIWAPIKRKDGQGTFYHWEMLTELQKGDIVLNYANGHIRSVSMVVDPAIVAPRQSPTKDEKWAEEGRLVKLDYYLLEPPIKLEKFNTDILDLKISQGPINSAGRVNQGYLFRFSIDGLKCIQASQPETQWPDFTKYGNQHIVGKRSWLFQANPKLYDLRSAVSHLNELNWKVSSFRDEIKIGDRVYFWEGGPNASIVAIGEVITEPSDLRKDENELPFIKDHGIDDDNYPRTRVKITYVLDIPLSKNQLLTNPLLSNMQIIRAPMGSNFKITREEDAELRRLIPIHQPPINPSNLKYTIEEFVKDTGFSFGTIESWKRRLLRKKHIIFQGPPGTGKTFVAQNLAKHMISETVGFCELVQFHPSYAYEDFMQGIRPNLNDEGSLSYELEDGRFIEFCKKAEALHGSPCILIIDEINRANLSRVFGELMYLLEYRESEIPLSGGTRFKIPDNVFVIGTMNTADRSIAVVDHALRRRFSFIRLNPEYEILRNYLLSKKYPGESLVKVLSEINKVIDDPNYAIGISYFMKKDDDLMLNLPEIWISEIESYLEEYFYDKPSKVDPFRWEILSKSKLNDWCSTVKSDN